MVHLQVIGTKEKNKMKNICITFFLLIICASLHAQTADFIQTLLQTQAVSYEQAARFVLEAADLSASYDKTNGQDAMRFAVAKKWLPKNVKSQDAISLERLSLLILRAFCLKGGPMYSIFHNAHYSYREMVFQDIIQGRSDPQMNVSGEKMLFIVSRVLFLIEDNPWELSAQTEEIHVDLLGVEQ
jgi:hypothetical protein